MIDREHLSESEHLQVIEDHAAPEALRVQLTTLKFLTQERERRQWLFKQIKIVAAWAAGAAAIWAALKETVVTFLKGLLI